MPNGTPLELIAVEVRADIDQLERGMTGATRVVDASMGQITRSVGSAERSVALATANIGRGMDNAAQRSRLLGYQISDIGVQLASGTSPFLVLAQQAPQVANALEGATGAAGRMAAFFSGPWGAALLAAASIAGVLAGDLLKIGDAADDATGRAQRLAKSLENLRSLSFNSQDLTETTSEMLKLRGEAAELERRAVQAGADRGAGGLYYRQLARQKTREADDLQRELRAATDPNSPIRRIVERNRNGTAAAQEPVSPRGGGGGRVSGTVRVRVDQGVREAQRQEDAYNRTKRQLELDARLQALRAQGEEQQADRLAAIARLQEQFPELANSTLQADRDRLAILEQIATATIDSAYARKAEQEAAREQEKTAKENERKRLQAADELARRQEMQVRSLATIYEDAFRGGTAAIWDDFKAIGFRVIAETLARFTISQLNGGGGGIGDFFGAAVGSVLGFASGGSMTLRGRGGTDTNRLSLNGRPIANVSRGETLNIGSRASRGSSAPTIINQTFTLDARGGITTPELLQYVNRTAQAAGQAAYNGAVRDTPVVMAKRNRYG